MRLDVRAIDGQLLRNRAAGGHLLENAVPYAAACPAMISVVDRLCRAVFDRDIAPAAADLQDVEYAGNDTTIIDATSTRLVLWKMRLDCRPGLIRKPEKIAHHEPPCCQNLKSKESANIDNSLIRSSS